MGQESTLLSLGSWISALALLPDEARLLRELVAEDPIPTDQLRVDLAEHLAQLTSHSAKHEFVDLDTATLLNSVCHKLLDRLAGGAPEDHRRMVQAAVRYFLLDDDAESDLHSPIGFDDDAQVIKVVAGAGQRNGRIGASGAGSGGGGSLAGDRTDHWSPQDALHAGLETGRCRRALHCNPRHVSSEK